MKDATEDEKKMQLTDWGRGGGEFATDRGARGEISRGK